MPRPNLEKAAQGGKPAFRTALLSCPEPDAETIVTALFVATVVLGVSVSAIAKQATITVNNIHYWIAFRYTPKLAAKMALAAGKTCPTRPASYHHAAIHKALISLLTA